jgi:putative hydrolase of the HAD superfamily
VSKALLLDFGGVVLKTPFELRSAAEPIIGPLPWAGPFDPDTDLLWRKFSSGEITERQLWAIRANEYGLDTKQLMALFYEPSGDHLTRPQMVDFIARCKRGGRVVGMLTNDMDAFHGPEWKHGITVIAAFDFVIDGSITGVLKPAPQAFRYALDALGSPDPADVVFVDDLPVNIAGAEAVGMTTVWFDPTDVTGSIERIEQALT